MAENKLKISQEIPCQLRKLTRILEAINFILGSSQHVHIFGMWKCIVNSHQFWLGHLSLKLYPMTWIYSLMFCLPWETLALCQCLWVVHVIWAIWLFCSFYHYPLQVLIFLFGKVWSSYSKFRFKSPSTWSESTRTLNSKDIKADFNLIAQRLMAKTTQKSGYP